MIEVGQLWISNSTNGECGMIITEPEKKGFVKFRGVGKHLGVDFMDGKTSVKYLEDSFTLVSKAPSWMPKLPDWLKEICLFSEYTK